MADLARQLGLTKPDQQPDLPGQPMGIGEGLMKALGIAGSGPLAPVAAYENMQQEKNLAGNPDFYSYNGQPVQEGMIPRPGNLDTFNAIKDAHYQNLLSKGMSPSLADAMSFSAARYPLRFRVPKNYSTNAPEAEAFHPGFTKDSNGLHVMFEAQPDKTRYSRVWMNDNLGRDSNGYVSTLTHEQQHAVDAKRNWDKMDRRAGAEWLQGDYWSDDPAKGQMAEIRARKAGNTGATAFQRYRDLQRNAALAKQGIVPDMDEVVRAYAASPENR